MPGLWISPDRLESLPTAGEAWDRMVEEAEQLSGPPVLDQSSKHDVRTLAAALIAARTGDQRLRDLVSLTAVRLPQTTFEDALGFGRSIPAYILAFDLIDLRGGDATDRQADSAVCEFLIEAIRKPTRGHGGAKTVLGTASRSPNNWGANARAALAAIGIYCQEPGLALDAARWHEGWLGNRNAHSLFRWTDTRWHAEASAKRGINARGATVEYNGRRINVDGVLPEDMRRYKDDNQIYWPPPYVNYVWGALGPAVVCSILLNNANLLTLDAGDDAIVRAATFLHAWGHDARGDDSWVPYLLNDQFGMSLPVTTGRPGKGMGFCDWTHV